VTKLRSDQYCHDCQRVFVALIDLSISGNHEIQCVCGHIHYRVVVDGKVTGDRWNSKLQTTTVKKSDISEVTQIPIPTSSASHFLRDKWLNLQG